MIENLHASSGCVTWKSNGRNIILNVDDAFFATENEKLELIEVESGKNFIATKVYYYSYDGSLVLYYDLNLNIVNWTYQGKHKNLFINQLKQVIFLPQKQKIFILSDGDGERQELYGYNVIGDCLFKVNQPVGFKMQYFACSKDQISIVCDGDKNHEDQYGRSRYNFLLDVNNGNLSKGNLAY